MDNRFCDLHAHSYYSDGTSSPEEILNEAKRIGLSAVALTDHNTVAGVPEFLRLAKEKDVTAIGGIEFSAVYREKELHVLALFVREEALDRINELTAEVRRKKEESNINLVSALSSAGYKIDYDKIKENAKSSINRANIATELVGNGYCKDIATAMTDILAEGKGFYIPPERLSVFYVLDFIREIGAVSVLAHPFLQFDEQGLREFLSVAVPRGLCAMETHYSTYSEETTALAEKIAEEYKILQSGGSDFHADRKPNISLGYGEGNLFVPFSFYEALKNKIDN